MTSIRPPRTLIAGLAALAGAVLLSAAPASAQLAPGGGPIAFGADAQEFLDAQRVLHLRGRAELIQGTNRLRANLISVHFAADPGGAPAAAGGSFGSGVGDAERITADGEVYFVTPGEVVRGDNAVYTFETDTIVVTGDVIVTRGQNVLTGSRLTVEIEAGRSTMDGVPTEYGRRVRGVFYPEEQN